MSNIELKPCPCGGNAVKIKIFSHKRYDCFYMCDKCERQTKVYVSPQGAKNAWNRMMSKDMMKAYRVEDQERGHGIWRDFDGTVNPVFSQLTQGKCKDMPMEDNDFYRYDGKQWFSATDTPEKLNAWFSALDVIEMQDLGYSVFEFDISSCRVVSEYEICFTRDSILSQKKIDPRSIYGEEYEKALAERRKVKQIEEMANDLYDNRPYEELWLEDAEDVARVLYNAGYRKQSEGEWVDADPNGHLYRFTCSLCGKTKLGRGTSFCPNCGAKMNGGE